MKDFFKNAFFMHFLPIPAFFTPYLNGKIYWDQSLQIFDANVFFLSSFFHVCTIIILIIVAYFQLAKMFIVVLIVFGLCWLPYHAYFFYTYYHVVTPSIMML